MGRMQLRPARIALWLASGALLLATLSAAAAPRSAGYAASAESRPLTPGQRLERRFLQITAANVRFQAEASRVVLARSGNPAVLDLARTVLDQQEQVQPELVRLLHARGMALPIMTSEHARVLKALAKANGARLDRIYVDEAIVHTYQADVANYEKLTAQAEDPVLKAWVERQLPALRFHLAKAGRVLPNAPPALRNHRAM